MEEQPLSQVNFEDPLLESPERDRMLDLDNMKEEPLFDNLRGLKTTQNSFRSWSSSGKAGVGIETTFKLGSFNEKKKPEVKVKA